MEKVAVWLPVVGGSGQGWTVRTQGCRAPDDSRTLMTAVCHHASVQPQECTVPAMTPM